MTDPAEELVDYEEEELAPEPKAGEAGAPAAGAKKAGFVGIHSSGFKDFLLKPELLRAIVDCGFEHPSEGMRVKGAGARQGGAPGVASEGESVAGAACVSFFSAPRPEARSARLGSHAAGEGTNMRPVWGRVRAPGEAPLVRARGAGCCERERRERRRVAFALRPRPRPHAPRAWACGLLARRVGSAAASAWRDGQWRAGIAPARRLLPPTPAFFSFPPFQGRANLLSLPRAARRLSLCPSLVLSSPLVQHECIPQAILGMDVLCQAKSGMGKTAVFVLSVLQQLEPVDGEVGAIIVCHTRELAYQVRDGRDTTAFLQRVVTPP